MSVPNSTNKLDIQRGVHDARGLVEHSIEVAGERPSTDKPLFLTILKGIMNLMVDGLSPGVKSDKESYDLIVVGGGPTGLTAALHAARQGIDTLVIERGGAGGPAGVAGVMECIDYCPGALPSVEDGRPGYQGKARVKHFQLATLTGRAVTAIWAQGDRKVIATETGGKYYARALLLATGTRFRRLNVPGEEDLIGAGIHFCATCDGPFYEGQDLVVVGGGNSGVEEGLFLTEFANKVTLLEVRDRLGASRILQDKAAGHPRMEVRLNTTVKEFKGDGKLGSVVVQNVETGATEVLTPGAVFMFIGLDPNTDFLGDVVELDQRGFIKTSQTLETSIEGVFAAGRARAGFAKEAVGAVGEGATAASMIRQYLEQPVGSRAFRGN